MIKRIIRKMCSLIVYFPRKIYYYKKRKNLYNSDFSIISSDCFGSFVYHNLNLKFNSPTINLFFSSSDFILFVNHLKEYLEADLTECLDHDKNYPVGELSYNDQKIKIYFMHYKTFREAKSKWETRKRRINFSNIYIIQTVVGEVTQEFLKKFESLPYKNKLLITKNNNFQSECIVTHPIFQKSDYRPGEILEYKSWFSCKRHMDDIGYVDFLNRK